MAILVDKDTRLVVQGLTGSEGRFHGLRNRAYGTNLVAGVTPGKGGQDVEGVPVLDTVVEAVVEHGANTAMVFVPAPFAADAIYEAIDAGVHTVITITEGVPAHEMLRIHGYARAKGVRALGPNCPGALSPGKANVGIIPAEIFTEGRSASSPARDAHLPDRSRADADGARQLDDRRHRRRPRRRFLVRRRPRACSRTTPRPSTS